MSDWDTTDASLLVAALTGVDADTKATKRLIKRGGEETNPLLPRKPSGQDLDKAGAIAALLGTGTAMALPEKWRKPMLGAWAGLEHGLAYKNNRVNPNEKTSGLEGSHLEGPLMMAALGGLVGHLMDDSKGKMTVSMRKENKSPASLLLGYKTDF